MRLSVESGWGEWLRLFEGRKRLLKMSHREKETFFFSRNPRKDSAGFFSFPLIKKKEKKCFSEFTTSLKHLNLSWG